MVIPKGVLNVFTDVFKEYPSSVSLLTQKTLAAFMKEGHWESYLRRNRKLQKKKHDALVAALESKFGSTISVFGKNAGLHLLVQVNRDISEKDLMKRAEEVGVKVYPTDKFWSNPENNKYSSVVFGFGGIEFEDISPAVDLLVKAWTNTD